MENWDDPVTWQDKRHIRVSVATDASATGWGAILLAPRREEISDYWTEEQCKWGIAAKKATAVDMALMAFKDKLFNARVDAFVDNKAVVEAWNNQGGRSLELNMALKRLFFTTSKLSLSLHISYIPTGQNPADAPSRRLSHSDSKLSDGLWQIVQKEFGGREGHTCDLMAFFFFFFFLKRLSLLSLFTTLSNYKYNNLRNLQYNVATHTFYSTPTVAYTTYNTRQYNSILTPPLLDTTIATITTKYHCYYFYGIAIHCAVYY